MSRPDAICLTCGHATFRHDDAGCHFPDCDCAAFCWDDEC